MRIEENYSLLKHNTFGIDVKARWFMEYDSEDDLMKILSDEYFLSQPCLHIGAGSNILFLRDYDGIILHSGLKELKIAGEDERFVRIRVGAGVVWDDFVAFCVEKGWSGLENLSLIPGEAGASAVQNIGAYGVEVCDCIAEVHAYHINTKEKKVFSKEDCHFAYRKSVFKGEYQGQYIITQVVFQLSKQPVYQVEYGNLREILSEREITLKTIREAIITIRESKLPDPAKFGNAGSFFMNPYVERSYYELLKKKYPGIPHYAVSDHLVKIPAAWLIDQCGLKGTVYQHAAVHEKQPLVIINKGGASGREIAILAEKIKLSVQDKFGITLEPEVYYV